MLRHRSLLQNKIPNSTVLIQIVEALKFCDYRVCEAFIKSQNEILEEGKPFQLVYLSDFVAQLSELEKKVCEKKLDRKYLTPSLRELLEEQ